MSTANADADSKPKDQNNDKNNNTTNDNDKSNAKPAYPYGGTYGTGSSFSMTKEEYDKLDAKNAKYKKTGQKVLAIADIRLNSHAQPWDMVVHNPKLYSRVLSKGSLGLGEAFMEGWWDTADFYALDEFFVKILRSDLEYYFPDNALDMANVLKSRMFNGQTIGKSKKVGMQHYDLGNEFFSRMLDKYMQYSCGYWEKHVPMTAEEMKQEDEAHAKQANGNKPVIEERYHPKYAFPRYKTVKVETLDEAQELKLTLIAEKLRLRPGMRLLDVGCGWGGLAQFMCERYGVSVTGITISAEQMKLAQARCAHLGDRVKILLQDYRDTKFNEQFDRIVSVGMFEHVGPKNYSVFFKHMRRLLKCRSEVRKNQLLADAKAGKDIHVSDGSDANAKSNLDEFGEEDGIFLLHTIGSNITKGTGDQWFAKYIFPGGCLPSAANMSEALEGHFVLEDWHNFGHFYGLTIAAWRDNFLKYWNSEDNEIKKNSLTKEQEEERGKKGKRGSGDIDTAAAKTQDEVEMFFRMFYYYLSACVGGFRSRDLQLWQLVLTPRGDPGYIDSYRP